MSENTRKTPLRLAHVPTRIRTAQEPVNYFFTAVFTLELALNLYGHGVRPFLADPCGPP